MNKVVIVSGSRTAVGAFGGVLKDVPVVDMGAAVLRETMKKAGLRPVKGVDFADTVPVKLADQQELPLESTYSDWDQGANEVAIDEVIMGNVLQSGQGQNPARQAMVRAGINKETPAFTLNKVCGSGLKAIALGAQSIMTGQAEVVLAGGQENMSQVPMAMLKGRWGYRMELTGVGEVHDLMVYDALYEKFYGYHMGVTAENIANLYNISRKDQDKLACLSHARAMEGIEKGYFAEEIVPLAVKKRKQEVIVDRDERPMATSMEKMAKLRPVFAKDGSVTAGNASGINDGAAAVLLMSEEKAKSLGLKPLLTIESFASLIRKNEVSIYDIPIVSICDQYHAHLRAMQELDLDVAGDFLWMASWLLHLKSKLLLPTGGTNEEDPRDELVERLLAYRRVKELASYLHDSDIVRRSLWSPDVEAKISTPSEPELDWEDVDLRLLAQTYLDVMQRFEASHPPPIEVLPLRYKVEEKMTDIYQRVNTDGMVPLLRHLNSRSDAEEVVTVIVAALELVRLRGVFAEQRKAFAEIYLRPGDRQLSNRELLHHGENSG